MFFNYKKEYSFNSTNLKSSTESVDNKFHTDDAVEGYFTWGPYTKMHAGKLNVTIRYESNTAKNMIDIFSSKTGKIYYQSILPQNDSSFTFTCVLPTDLDDLEIRSYYAGDGYFTLESISVLYLPWFVGQPFMFLIFINILFLIFFMEIGLPVTKKHYEHQNIEIELFRFLMCLAIMILHFSEDYISSPGFISGAYCGVDFFS